VSRRLVVGAGCSRGCPPAELVALIDATAAEAGGGTIAVVATIDGRAAEPCMRVAAGRHGVPLRTHPAAALAGVAVPTPSAEVARHVGTPSVAEAAALLTAGPGARLLVPKRRSEHATCAVAEAGPWPA
jgi:cobalt-precorrin 5A hydrolase/cobalt-precorrin 5A hydrolase/precorrin-3B C17-methyltransferase